ncbi:NTR domain-containing protein [Dirofilaria immitis]
MDKGRIQVIFSFQINELFKDKAQTKNKPCGITKSQCSGIQKDRNRILCDECFSDPNYLHNLSPSTFSDILY